MIKAPTLELSLQERFESLFKVDDYSGFNGTLFSTIKDIIEEAKASQTSLDLDVIVRVRFDSKRILECILDVAQFLVFWGHDISIDNLLLQPMIFSHMIKHLHRKFKCDYGSIKSFWSWIVKHSAKIAPEVCKKILLEHSESIDFVSKIKYQGFNEKHLSCLEMLLIKSPEMLPLVIQKKGRENIGLENIAIFRTHLARTKDSYWNTPDLKEYKAFIDFAIKNKEYALLRNALLQEEKGILAQEVSVDYLLEKHPAILLYIVKQLGIPQVEEYLGVSVDLSSPQVLGKLLTEYYVDIEEESEFFNVVKAVIQKAPQDFISASMTSLSNKDRNEDELKKTVSKIIQLALTLDLDADYWNNGKIVSHLKNYADFEKIKTKIQFATVLFYLDFEACWQCDKNGKSYREYIWEWCLAQPDEIQLFENYHFPHKEALSKLEKILKRYEENVQSKDKHVNIKKFLTEVIVFCQFFYKEKSYGSSFLKPRKKYLKIEDLKNKLSSFLDENKKIFLNWQADSIRMKPLVCTLENYDDDFTLTLLEQGADSAEILDFELEDTNDTVQTRKQALREVLIHILARKENEEAMMETSEEAIFKRILAGSLISGPHQKEDQNIILRNLIAGRYYAVSEHEGEVCLGKVMLATNASAPLSDSAKERNWQLIVLYALEINDHITFNRYTEILAGTNGMEGVFSAKSKDALFFQACDELAKLSLYAAEEHKMLIFSNLSASTCEPIKQDNNANVYKPCFQGPK